MKLTPIPESDHEVMFDDYHSLVWIEWVNDFPFLHIENRSCVCRETVREAFKRLNHIRGTLRNRSNPMLYCIVPNKDIALPMFFGFDPADRLPNGEHYMRLNT